MNDRPRVEIVDLSEFQQDPDNVRVHNPANLGIIERSLGEVGAMRSLAADENGIIHAGSGTLAAARAAGFKRAIVVDTPGDALIIHRRSGLSPEEWQRYALADNAATDASVFDENKLGALAEFSPNVLRGIFSDEMIDAYRQQAERTEGRSRHDDDGPQLDRAGELLVKWDVHAGDVWSCDSLSLQTGAAHVLCCGNALDPAIARALLSEQPDILIADPPYGINLTGGADGEVKSVGNSGAVYRTIAGDADNSLARRMVAVYRNLLGERRQIWWGANHYAGALPASPGWVVWDKDHHGMTFADAELAWTNAATPVRIFVHAWSGNHRDSEQGQDRLHVNQKPVALYEWLLREYGSNCATLLDPCFGSASSLVAAENMGKRFIGAELEPAFVAVALERATATGLRVQRVVEG